MKRRHTAKIVAVLILASVFVTGTGCAQLASNSSLVAPTLLWGSNVVSGVTGWILGAASASVNAEQQCYKNGVLVDCSELPENLR